MPSITLTSDETQTVLQMLEVIGRQFHSYRPEQKALLRRLVGILEPEPAAWVPWGLTLPVSED